MAYQVTYKIIQLKSVKTIYKNISFSGTDGFQLRKVTL